MKLSRNQEIALEYINKHPEGIVATEMKHLFEGDEGRARAVAYQLWKKKQVKRKPFWRKERRYGMGISTTKRVRYYPLDQPVPNIQEDLNGK